MKIFKQLGYVQIVKGKEGWLSRIKYTDKFYDDVIEKFKLNPQDILKIKPNIIKTKKVIVKAKPSITKKNSKKTKK